MARNQSRGRSVSAFLIDMRHLVGWTRLLFAAVLCIAFSAHDIAWAQDPRATLVQKTARDWLAVADRGDANASWNAAGKQFQNAITVEEVAQQKFACPACGAEAVWNPTKQALVCSFCGTTSPAQLDTTSGKIVEHDLVSALRGITDDKRGWQTEKRYVKCRSCQAIS